jgi:hypothetical protein
VNWDRIQSDLERARRDLLSREFGPGPHTPEIAHHQVSATLLRRTALAFLDEAQRLAQGGLSPQAAMVREQAARLRERAAALDASAARLEADQVRAEDPQRYAALRTSIQSIELPVPARDLANEIAQAALRLGAHAAETLWRELQRRCAARQIKFPADLEPRLRQAIEAAAADRRVVPAASNEEIAAPPGELVLAADRLVDEAPVLSREDLYDRIVVIASQLKMLQDQPDRLPGEAERALVRQGFGILTRLSKIHQPGWTQALDPRAADADWPAMLREARQRLSEREEARRRVRARARLEQVADALRDLHETERRIVFQESLERLRARVYELDGLVARGAVGDESTWLCRDARTQAAIACSAAAGEEDRLERISQVVGARAEVIGVGRVFRAMRRFRGLEEPDEDAGARATVDDIDQDEVDFTTGDLDGRAWPEDILEMRGAGSGERILLVGGIPNTERQRLLREFFAWRAVDWEESYRDHSADFRALRARIRAGNFDRVIVLSRFCGHDVTQGLREVTRRSEAHYHVHPRSVSIPSIATFVYGPAAENPASPATPIAS